MSQWNTQISQNTKIYGPLAGMWLDLGQCGYTIHTCLGHSYWVSAKPSWHYFIVVLQLHCFHHQHHMGFHLQLCFLVTFPANRLSANVKHVSIY